ncbi:transporter [Ganoderma sinense ZZ0214-1]|uniref:Transporter n=1 Tax=Ganoderma sinense ZZ0214-1 TaxID=1077348 RepID=A0A2G8SIB4_9APHY|nr:transporter [Ganoderma sinense ZZ0214-1]
MGLPDENIHPHATGRAATTVAEHQEPQDLIFYSGWFCPYVQRVWIVLEERGIPYQYKEVNPYKKEAHFLAINPKGLVPAIEYKGRALYESLTICEFLEDAFPPSTSSVLPADPFDRALVRLWTDHVNKQVVPAYMRLIQQQDAQKQRDLLAELTKALQTLCAQVKGPYFFGEQFTLVDVALAPWVTRDWVVAEHRGYSREAVGAGWAEYAARLESRESVVKTQSERVHFTEIYGRYLRDEAQSEGAKAIRAGRSF